MIDFNKPIYNTSKFRSPAIHFQKYGYYCNAPQGTKNIRNTGKKKCIDV